MNLRATRHQAPDEASALEVFHLREWTDGLPVVIPTEERVEDLLAGVEIDPDVIVGMIGAGQATVEKIAINAVMAGCRPEHFRSSWPPCGQSATRSSTSTTCSRRHTGWDR